MRNFNPPNSGNPVGPNQRAAQAIAAQQAAVAAAAARNAAAIRNNAAAQQATTAATAARNAAARNAAAIAAGTPTKTRHHGNSPQAYGYGGYPYVYSPYGYAPYGYYPPGTTPYVMGYDPSTGTAFLYPYGGSGYSSYYPSYGYQYPYYRNPYLGYGYPAAVFMNPNQFFGIGPIQQLMGVDGWFQQPQANANGFANGNPNPFANANGNAANANPGLANNNNNARAGAAGHDADPPAHKPAAPVAGKALEIAWKFITYGDAHFGNQKYNDALDRYRRAARECPALADAWLRQGFALAASGRYDQAAKAMRRGLEEKPDWVDNNFRLSDLYGNDSDDKKATLDKMVKAAEAQPNNADLAYVLGVHLYCDGKPDQAAPFFRRAAQILGTDVDVKPFLPKGR